VTPTGPSRGNQHVTGRIADGCPMSSLPDSSSRFVSNTGSRSSDIFRDTSGHQQPDREAATNSRGIAPGTADSDATSHYTAAGGRIRSRRTRPRS